MSSFVYYKFRSQREPLRVTFDGTGISVFDLKREIILANKLGDGMDFDLSIYNADTNEEYEDDSEILSRSSSVVARRKPPAKLGRGTGSRYVSARAPAPLTSLPAPTPGSRKPGLVPIDYKRFQAGQANESGSSPSSAVQQQAFKRRGPGESSSEEDMINAMFQAQSESWTHTQEKMASATPVYGRSSSNQRQRPPAPDHPPPPGYVCYRCGQKGHWIQNCPTNNDPNWEHRRMKRTTGIPKSFLKTVSKDEIVGTDGTALSGDKLRVDENGEYVVVQPDSAAWQSYLQKQRNDAIPDDGAEDEYDQGDDTDRRKRVKKSNGSTR
ncbi:DWNN domain-containing protein [Lipomyces tetrasporus]|uniref:DWNN domain-containing protein n=1 Tax=Lipomyces tetrasporus TaxID=54092 RepID=A0AAD7QS14_9ASCO|nr:DWNN domain-containing protein [Lipomyces tetrasporus]KAJ8100334.1 DWNN domain-containing protein [Lipomyces tetrasporus]